MRSLIPLVIITFKEGIRNRALYGITLLSLALFGFTLVVSNMAPRDVGKVAVDLSLSTISFAGVLLVLFVGINLVAKDIDRRTIYMVLARPISRAEYIVGKYLGMALLITLSAFVLGLFALGTIGALKTAYPNYFEHFSWAVVVWGFVLTLEMLLVLCAVSFFFSSFTSTSFITLVLTMITYLIGQSLNDVKTMLTSTASGVETATSIKRLVQTSYYLFPNLSLFDIKAQAAHGIAVPASYLLTVTLYGIVYSSIMLLVASMVFKRREFP